MHAMLAARHARLLRDGPVLDEAPWTARPVFICGMPRSGTTLVESVLLQAPGVVSIGECSALHAAESRHLARDVDAAALRRAQRDYATAAGLFRTQARLVLDKMPNNVIHADTIVRALPGARLVVTRKPPAEACLSVYRQLFGGEGHGYSYHLASAMLVHRWQDRFIETLSERYPDRLFVMDYADAVDPDDHAWRALGEFLGIGWDPAWREAAGRRREIRTLSATQLRGGITRAYLDRVARYGEAAAGLLALPSHSDESLLAMCREGRLPEEG